MIVPEGWLRGGGTTKTIGSLLSRVRKSWRDNYSMTTRPSKSAQSPSSAHPHVPSFRYMRHHMTLLHDPDHQALTTDPTLTVITPEGKQVTVLPFRLGPTHSQPRREVQTTVQRPTPAQTPIPSMPPGTPISMQSQLKKIQQPTTVPDRIPSAGSMRPPAPPTMPAISTHASPEPQADTPSTAPGEGNTTSQDATPQSQPETQAQPQPDPTPTPVSTSPARPPSQNQQPAAVGVNIPVITNNFVTGFSTTLPTPLPYPG